ncbi:hypothetical protein HK405_002632 [Cladochytrium tenue]|nr:hypothetical protein HK405_002632 [Cladochytrium tenue]
MADVSVSAALLRQHAALLDEPGGMMAQAAFLLLEARRRAAADRPEEGGGCDGWPTISTKCSGRDGLGSDARAAWAGAGECISLVRRAAARGYAPAMFELGAHLFERGHSTAGSALVTAATCDSGCPAAREWLRRNRPSARWENGRSWSETTLCNADRDETLPVDGSDSVGSEVAAAAAAAAAAAVLGPQVRAVAREFGWWGFRTSSAARLNAAFLCTVSDSGLDPIATAAASAAAAAAARASGGVGGLRSGGAAMFEAAQEHATRGNAAAATLWLRLAAESGHAEAMLAHSAQLAVGGDAGLCASWLLKCWSTAGAGGNARGAAALALGELHTRGFGMRADAKAATRWFARAWHAVRAPEAAFAVGLARATGFPPGFARMGQASAAAETSGILSEVLVRRLLVRTQSVSGAARTAESVSKWAPETETASATAVPVDYMRAAAWYRRAVSGSAPGCHARAANNLGELLVTGRGMVQRNEVEAFRLFLQAAM